MGKHRVQSVHKPKQLLRLIVGKDGKSNFDRHLGHRRLSEKRVQSSGAATVPMRYQWLVTVFSALKATTMGRANHAVSVDPAGYLDTVVAKRHERCAGASANIQYAFGTSQFHNHGTTI